MRTIGVAMELSPLSPPMRRRGGEGDSPESRARGLPPSLVQPGTWVTVLTGDIGNTFLVLFSPSTVAVRAVDPVGNAQRCPQVHSRAWVCAGGCHHARSRRARSVR